MEINMNKNMGKKSRPPISRGRIKAALAKIIAVLSILALVCGAICLVLYLQTKHVTVEVGGSLAASDIVKDECATFGDDYDERWLSHAGVYFFTVHAGEKSYDVRLRVEDTHAPVVTVKDVYIAIGGELPRAEDFIDTIYEPDDFTGEIVGEMPEMKSPGKYPVKVRYTDVSGNKTKMFDVNMILIYDSVAPNIEAASDIFVYVGESVAYRSVISVSDNCIGEIELTVDDSAVDISKAGEYKVKITAKDAVKNKSRAVTVTVHVMPENDVREKLEKKIEGAIKSIINDEMTTEQKCRVIYDYIQKKIEYAPISYHGDATLAAYKSLFVTGEGDCYSYFAAAKAFFDYLGIENYAVKRAEGHTADTHYWNLVNIGEGGEDRWYHFDATEMREEYAINSCLLTDAQTEAYSKLRPYFYEYDKKNFPPVESEIITPNSNLES